MLSSHQEPAFYSVAHQQGQQQVLPCLLQHIFPPVVPGQQQQQQQPVQQQQGPTKSCLVCGMPSTGIRCGAQACDACKKFFLRNRNNLANLECITGREDCMSLDKSYASDLLVRRQYCSRCRLKRCVEIGMRYFGRNRQLSSQQSTAEASTDNSSGDQSLLTVDLTAQQQRPTMTTSNCTLTRAPSRYECSAAEMTLKTVTMAVAELGTFQSMPWTVRVGNFPNDASFWLHAMVNFNYIVEHGATYVKLLNGFTELPVPDRCCLFSRSLVPHLVAQVTLPNHRDYRLFGLAPELRKRFIRFFPVFKICEDISEEIASVMDAWDPTFSEFALLQAMVFFRSDRMSEAQQLRRPRIVQGINRQLLQALDWYLAQRQNPDVRKHYFMRVYELLRHFEDNYTQVIIRHSNDRPDLVHLNRTFAEMYNLPPIEREEQYHRLGLPPLESCLLTRDEKNY